MIHQLRIYEIFEHNEGAFHARFRDHAARIMRTYGFELVAMQGDVKVEKSSTDCTDYADVRPILCEICVICGYLLCPTLTLTCP